MIERFRHAMLFVMFLGLAACGGGGGGGGSGAGGSGSAEPLADCFVISGNSDGTISVLRVDPIAGFAHAVGFLDSSDHSARDLVVDPDNEHVVLLTSHTIDTIGFDPDTGVLSSTGQTVDAGSSGGFLGTLTLAAPLL